jgi:hypothetical protein
MKLSGGMPCSCGGNNSRCSRCYGTGVLERAIPRLVSRPHHSGRMSATTIRCPKCSAIVGASRLKRHLLRVHEDPITDPRERARAGLSISAASHQLVICHYCKASVRSDRLEKHLLKVHSNAIAARPKPPTGAPLSPAFRPRTALKFGQPETSNIVPPTTSVSRTGCYCYPIPGPGEILRDLLRNALPDDALVCTGCWKEICRARGLNFKKVNRELWRETCSKRGYLIARENPRGF